MSWIRFSLTVILVVAATASVALMQGRAYHRWGLSDSVRKAGDRLQEFPRDFDNWHMTSASNLDEESRNELQCVSELVRVYRNAKTGDQVSLLLILGPTGPTAVHTPEVCIGRREFEPLGDRREVAVGGGSDRFWSKRFKALNVHGEPLSVYWAWNTDGCWLVPKDARYRFAGLPFLYKAQVTCGFDGRTDGDPDDAGRRFLDDFVRVAPKYIVPDLRD